MAPLLAQLPASGVLLHTTKVGFNASTPGVTKNA